MREETLSLNKRVALGLFFIFTPLVGVLVSVLLGNVQEQPAEEPSITLASAPEEQKEPEEQQDELVVHVAGAVRTPGIVRLASPARVDDAITAAGGVSPEVDTLAYEQSLNLAEWLQDGDKIYIPRRGEEAPALGLVTVTSKDESGSGLLDLNTATVTELVAAELYRIGPALAQDIVSYRSANGPFTSVDDLLGVPGIGEGTLSQIRGQVTVSP